MPRYDIQLSARISIGGEIEAPDQQAAVEMLKMELRQSGELDEITVDRAIWLHEEDPLGQVTAP